MKKRKGILELNRSVKGNTSIRVGIVTSPAVVGCPSVDTIFLQLTRDDKEVLFMAITPEEATIIGQMLLAMNVTYGGAE